MQEPVKYLNDNTLCVLNQTLTIDRLASEIVEFASPEDLGYLLIAIIDEVSDQEGGRSKAAELVRSHLDLINNLLRDYAALGVTDETAH